MHNKFYIKKGFQNGNTRRNKKRTTKRNLWEY